MCKCVSVLKVCIFNLIQYGLIHCTAYANDKQAIESDVVVQFDLQYVIKEKSARMKTYETLLCIRKTDNFMNVVIA